MINFPIRINHFLALKQYCSRREADKLIEKAGEAPVIKAVCSRNNVFAITTTLDFLLTRAARRNYRPAHRVQRLLVPHDRLTRGLR